MKLESRYTAREGTVFLTGVQALVRGLLDQRYADRAAGLNTATLVSGYPGSPLAGFDKAIAGLGRLADEHDIVLRPAVNEELGATAVWGSQLATQLPSPRYDGVIGVWYGKAPGLDRSADAIRHGNYVGTSRHGGAIALCADDPAAKSSTIPSASESLLAALQVPVLYPGSVQEVVDLSRHAVACSRASGLWAAMKIVTNVADAVATVEVGTDRVAPAVPLFEAPGRTYEHRPSAHLLAPKSLEMERSLVEIRLELAKRYGQLNRLVEVINPAPTARLGVIAGGLAYHDLGQALRALDLDPHAVPLRVLKVSMLFPLDDSAIRSFATGLHEVLVIEEKGPFLERLVKEALYGSPRAPVITGALDDRGDRLIPRVGTVDPDAIARALARRLIHHHDLPRVRAYVDERDARPRSATPEIGPPRTPYFCSGCPHNTSLVADDDVLVGAGIGCHTMVLLAPGGRGQVEGITQMGGEGVQWLGAAPFIADRHFVQNLGDGTFHHSGSLAIRAAVAAGLNVTYKLLYNDAVAMTGGQAVEGQLTVPALVESLAAEGVKRIIITTADRSRYGNVVLPGLAEVRDRSQLLTSQRELAAVPGVTVLVHDQACAAELRRDRKRGRVEEPPQRVVINERVCEGCGDCGQKSNCLSVEPIATEFGQKTRIHQGSCNKDYTCLDGDCPSFVTVISPEGDCASTGYPLVPALPDPEGLSGSDDVRVRLVGIGGTGVVTVSQILGMAAMLDGRYAFGLDQTGLSQKAGPVVSDVRIARSAEAQSVSPSAGSIDVLLGLDLLGSSAARNLGFASATRTVAIVATGVVPTGQMVSDPRGTPAPDIAAARAAIDAATRAQANVYVDAHELSRAVFDDDLQANVIVLGAAWQCGVLPVSGDALREAIRLNGVAIERNLLAFEWGRASVAAPQLVADLRTGSARPPSAVPARARTLIDRFPEDAETLRAILAVRIPDLIAWGGAAVAERYVDMVARVHAVERERVPGGTALTEAVARGLHKLSAYKDEYEVARLHLDFIRDLPRGTKYTVHLHPPVLRALGLKRKMRCGRWVVPLFVLLRATRRLRGTILDPFGWSQLRRIERVLASEYMAGIDQSLRTLSPETLDEALRVAELPELVRGYEDIKLAGVAEFRSRLIEVTGWRPEFGS